MKKFRRGKILILVKSWWSAMTLVHSRDGRVGDDIDVVLQVHETGFRLVPG
jgi:hypothetical protein